MSLPQALVSGTFTGTGQSAAIALRGKYNFSLSGFGTATVKLERSFDGGSSWKVMSKPDFSAASFSADVEGVGEEPEAGMLYRFNCDAHSSGTIAYRISQ